MVSRPKRLRHVVASIGRLTHRQRWRVLAMFVGGDEAARRIGVRVGRGCRVLSGTFGSEPWLISIGDRVTISHGVEFVTHDGTGWLFRDDRGRRYYYAPISIGSDVFVGARALLLPGVKIGDRCVIGAGSVVARSVPSGTVVGGVPARIIGSYDDLETRALTVWPSEDMITGDYVSDTTALQQGFRQNLNTDARP